MSFRKLLDEEVDRPGYFTLRHDYQGKWDLIWVSEVPIHGQDRYHVASIDIGGNEVMPSSTPTAKEKKELIGEIENAFCSYDGLMELVTSNLMKWHTGGEPKVMESALGKPSFQAKFDGKTARNTHWEIAFDPALPLELSAFNPEHPERGIKPWLDKKAVIQLVLDHDDIPEELHQEMVDAVVAALNAERFKKALVGQYYLRMMPEPRVTEACGSLGRGRGCNHGVFDETIDDLNRELWRNYGFCPPRAELDRLLNADLNLARALQFYGTCDSATTGAVIDAFAQDLVGRRWPVESQAGCARFWVEFASAALAKGYEIDQEQIVPVPE